VRTKARALLRSDRRSRYSRPGGNNVVVRNTSRVAIGVVAAGLVLSGCGPVTKASKPGSVSSPPDHTTSTTVPASATTVAPSTPATAPDTSTTTPLPPDPASSILGATTTLIQAWKSGERSKAATVATPSAVSSLFASPYSGQTVILRGCSQIPPVVCSYGPYGGSSPNLSLYQLTVASEAGGWYVSSVTVESQ